MHAQVLNNGESYTPFPVTNGVKQGCVLAPTLFSMMFTAMLTDAFQDSDSGINIRNRTDGKLFNLWHLQAKTKVHFDKLRDFLFADDCALNADSPEDMQNSMDLFSIACTKFGFTISTKKTEVMYLLQGNSTKNEQWPWTDRNWQLWTSSRTLAACCLAACTSMIWLMPGLPKPAWPLPAALIGVRVQGCESRNKAECLQSHRPHHFTVCQWDLDCLPEAHKETQLFPSQLPSQTAGSEVAGQGADRNVQRLHHALQVLCWAGHVARMSVERLPKCLLYLSWRPEEMLQGYTQSLHDGLWSGSQLMGDTCTGSVSMVQCNPQRSSSVQATMHRDCQDRVSSPEALLHQPFSTGPSSTVLPSLCQRTWIGLISHLWTHPVTKAEQSVKMVISLQERVNTI